MKRIVLALLAVVALGTTTARAQAVLPFESRVVGTYSITGNDGKTALWGRATIKGEGDGFTLTTTGMKKGLTGIAPLTSGGSSWTFQLVAGGLVDTIANLGSAASTRTLEVTVTSGDDLRGVIKSAGKAVGKVAFTRERAALIVHAEAYDETHARAFHGYAWSVARYYRSKGFKKTELVRGQGWETAIDALDSAQSCGQLYERVIVIGHGGWDGPILSKGTTSQASGKYNRAVFDQVVSALRRGTTTDARFAFSACHAGGSDRYERAAGGYSDYQYCDDIAVFTGRMAVGPAGKTSTEFTEQLVRALEGEDVTKQETRVALGNKAWTVGVKGKIFAKPPASAITTTPTPTKPTTTTTTTTTTLPPPPVTPTPIFNAPLGEDGY